MTGSAETPQDRRARALARMEEVYAMPFGDGEGEFWRYTADHLFADVWSRPGLSDRDRRLLLIGMLTATAGQDVLTILHLLDDGPDFPAQRLRDLDAAMAKHRHVAAARLGMGSDEDRGILTVIADRLEELIELLFVVRSPVSDERDIDEVRLQLDDRLARGKLVGALRHFIESAEN